MFNLDQTFRICHYATTNIIFDVQLDPVILVSSQEQSTSSKPEVPMSSKSVMTFFLFQIMFNLYQIFRICPHFNLQSETINIIQAPL